MPSWILSGSDLYIEGMSSDTDYPLDLDALPQDSKVSIKVTSDGDLHFFVNRVDMGVAASGLPTEGFIYFLLKCIFFFLFLIDLCIYMYL